MIEELDEKKKSALKATWLKVNQDFGAIFSTLLPGTQAKLEPPEGESFLDGEAHGEERCSPTAFTCPLPVIILGLSNCPSYPPLHLTPGLDLRVAFGDVWKESLTELSGGQRSLLALSLILALCR